MVNPRGLSFRYTTIPSAIAGAAFSLSLETVNASASEQKGFDTPRCKEAVARIVAEAGASFDHLAPSGDNVFLKHPAAREFVLMCASYRPLRLSISWRDAFPSAAYFELLGRAGAVITAADATSLSKATRSCQVAALKSGDEEAESRLPGASLDCTAFTRDGGGTLIGIRPPAAE